MQVAAALDFRRGPYMQLLAKNGDVEDTRAVRQPWSEWHKVLALVVMIFILIGIVSTGKWL